MKVIKYIKEHGLDKLESELGIDISRYDDRIVLNYNQIKSPKFNEVVQECRGLILSYPDLQVLSVSFSRFYNYGEDPGSLEFNIRHAITQEKVDGSITVVYHDGTKWNVQTRSMAFAEGGTKFPPMTFKDIFEIALGGEINKIFAGANPSCCYVFELVSPYNRVVKPYSESRLYPLMIKNRVTLEEKWNQVEIEEHLLWCGIAQHVNFGWLKIYKFDSIDHILTSMKELTTFDEGYVCVLGGGTGYPWRIKIKSPAYLAIAHLRNNGELSSKRVCELVFMNEHEEYLASFNEDRPLFEPYINAYAYIVENATKLFNDTLGLTDKEIGLGYKNHPFQGLLFAMRKKGYSIHDALDKMSDAYKVKLLEQIVEELK